MLLIHNGRFSNKSVAYSVGDIPFDANGIAVIPEEGLYKELLKLKGYTPVKEEDYIPIGEIPSQEEPIPPVDEETTALEEDLTPEEKTDTDTIETEVILESENSAEVEETLENEEELKERYNSYNFKRLELLVKKKNVATAGSKKKDYVDALVSYELSNR